MYSKLPKAPKNEFYDNVEEGVRDIVHLFRINGINTISSCAHKNEVQVELIDGAEMWQIHKLLFNHGYKFYAITGHWDVYDGHTQSFAEVKIGCNRTIQP